MTTEPNPAATSQPAATPTPASAQPSTQTTPSPSSPPANPSPSPAPAAADDLVTGAKPKEGEQPKAPEKPPETAAEKRAYLESKLDDKGKAELKAKTDADVEKLYTEQKTKEAESEALGDFKIENLKLPEDMPVPEEMKVKVNDLAKIFNNKELTAQEKLQKAVDLHVEIQQKQLADFVKTKTEWRDKVNNDPELKAMVGPANDVVRRFAGDAKQLEEFQVGLKFLGLGNHPAFVRFCGNIAKAMADDNFSGGGSGGQGAKKDLADMMYPGMKSQNATAATPPA